MMRRAPTLDYILDADRARGVARVEWGHTNQFRAEHLIATEATKGGSATEDAADFLRDCLYNGPVGAKEVKRLADEAGVSPSALRKAKGKLDVKSRKEGRPGASGRWIWELPEHCESQESPEGDLFGPKVTTPSVGH